MNWILLFAAYRYTSVSVATLSYYFAPSLVVLASALGEEEAFRMVEGEERVFCLSKPVEQSALMDLFAGSAF